MYDLNTVTLTHTVTGIVNIENEIITSICSTDDGSMIMAGTGSGKIGFVSINDFVVASARDARKCRNERRASPASRGLLWNSWMPGASTIQRIYLFINSIENCIREFIALVDLPQDVACIDFIFDQRRNVNLIQGNATIISNHGFLQFLKTNHLRMILPFTRDDIIETKVKAVPKKVVTLEASMLFVPLFFSFLHECIPTRERTFTVEQFYDSIFGELEELVSFGNEERTGARTLFAKLLNFIVDNCTCGKNSKILQREGRLYKIIPKNTKHLHKNLDEIQKVITEEIRKRLITLDDFV